MAHRRVRNQNRHSHKAMVRRRQRAVGLTGAISAFLTFGLGPLAHVPQAKADEFDVVIDQVLNAISGSLSDAVAAFDPSVGADLGSVGAGVADSTAAVDVGSVSSGSSFASDN